MRNLRDVLVGLCVCFAATLWSTALGLGFWVLAFLGLAAGHALTSKRMSKVDFVSSKTLKDGLNAAWGITHKKKVMSGQRPLFGSTFERVCLGAIVGFFAAVLVTDWPWFVRPEGLK